MTGALFLGLLIGMQHAFEADHVAAVATIAARSKSAKNILRHGVSWGLGHGLILFGLVGVILFLDMALSEDLAAGLELVVGAMLVILGVHLLYRLMRDRVHFHTHRHDGGLTHLHAHSHAHDNVDHINSVHRHQHAEGLPWRSLFIGMTHGLAGSAALVGLTAASAHTPSQGLAYVALFVLGSIVGMFVLSAIIAVPLRYTSKSLSGANLFLQGAIATISIVLGMSVLWGSGTVVALPL